MLNATRFFGSRRAALLFFVVSVAGRVVLLNAKNPHHPVALGGLPTKIT